MSRSPHERVFAAFVEHVVESYVSRERERESGSSAAPPEAVPDRPPATDAGGTPVDGWLDVCAVDEIPREGARRVELPAGAVALFRTRAGAVHALADRCPHRGGPLSEGIVHGACVSCPLHDWVIGLEDGRARGVDEGTVARHEVRVSAGRVLLARRPLPDGDD